MKKLLITSALLLSSIWSMAADIPKIFSSCIKMNPDGSESITASMNGLTWYPAGPPMDLWIHTGPTGSYTSADFLHLTSSSASPMYGPGGGLYTEATFLYTIPASQAIPLNECLEVFLGPALPSGDPMDAFQICPCMTDACYYTDPGTGHQTLTFYSPAAGPSSLSVYMDFGSGPIGAYSISSLGVPHGLQYAHYLDLDALGLHAKDCPTVWVSDIAYDEFVHSPYPSVDPANPDNWAYSFKACTCDGSYYGGCISLDERGNQTVTVHTNISSGTIYMWGDTYGPVASSSVTPDGAGGNLVTFDLAAFGIGITMECHTFYFNTVPTNPAPANPVVICPCDQNGGDPTTIVQFQHACMSLDRKGDEIITIETNNLGPNYAWYGSMGPMYQTGIAPNPTPGGLPYIATFSLSTLGIGIPFGPCYTFYFSSTPTSPAPSGGFNVCPCNGNGGDPTTARFQKGCMELDRDGNELISIETDNVGPNYAWYGSMGPMTQIGSTPNPAYPGTPGALPYIATFNLSSIGIGIPFGPCYTFYFSGISTSPAPAGGFSICPCGGGTSGKPGSAATKTVTSSLSVAPNPSNGTFTIKGILPSVHTSKHATVEVVDMLGRVVFSSVADIMNSAINSQVTLSNENASGIYMIRVKNEEVNEVVRMTVER